MLLFSSPDPIRCVYGVSHWSGNMAKVLLYLLPSRNNIMALYCLSICALSMVPGDISASFILPNVPGQQWVKVGYLNMTVMSPVALCGKKAGVPCGSVNITTSGASYQMVWERFLGYLYIYLSIWVPILNALFTFIFEYINKHLQIINGKPFYKHRYVALAFNCKEQTCFR